jgi:hypothetical protein
MSTAEDRAAFIAGLRKFADALESDERIPLPLEGRGESYALALPLPRGGFTGETFAATVRALGGTGWKQEIRHSTDRAYAWLYVTGRIDGLHVTVSANADDVCEPIEPQPVIQRTCPALDAVIAEAETERES